MSDKRKPNTKKSMKPVDLFIKELNDEKMGFSDDMLQRYIRGKGGIAKIKSRDFHRIFGAFPDYHFELHPTFLSLYKIATDRESSTAIHLWTWVVGICTVVSLIVTLFTRQ